MLERDMKDVTIDTLESVVQSYSDESYLQTMRTEEVRRMFNYYGTDIMLSETKLSKDNDPAPDNIMDVINKEQEAPASTSIVSVPSSISQSDIKNLRDISLLDSYSSVASAIYLYKLNPQGFDITTTDGAAFFTKSLANARLRVTTQGLSGVLSLGDSLQQSFSKTTTSVDLHLEFLSEIFGAFGFSPSNMKQLDSIMNNIVKQLSSLQGSWSDEKQTLDHLISMYYFEEVQGLPGEKIPKMRLFYLHIDPKSWKLSIGKSSVNKFTFNMNYSDQIFTMNPTMMDKMREPIQAYIVKMTDKQLEEIQKLLAMSALKPDKN